MNYHHFSQQLVERAMIWAASDMQEIKLHLGLEGASLSGIHPIAISRLMAVTTRRDN